MKTGIRKLAERTVVVTLAGVLAAGALTGCGNGKLDGTKTVATVNGTDITLGLVSLYARQQQAYTESMYASIYSSMGSTGSIAIWDTVADEETGETYGEQVVNNSLEQVELMYLMKEKAADYGVEVTAEDQAAIEEAAAAFMEANSEEAIEALGVTEEDVKTLLELRTYSTRIYDPIIEGTDREVSDEEAQQSGFSYVSLAATGENLTAEEIETTKANAQAILDKMKEDPSADMDAVAKEVDDSLSSYQGHIDANPSEDEEENSSAYPDEVIAALRELEDGQVADEVVETDTSYYILRMDEKFDEEATESEKESIISEREDDFYHETTEQWLEDADIQVQEKVLKTLTITDNHKFSFAAEETEEEAVTDEDAAAEDTADEADGETADEAGDSAAADGTDAADDSAAPDETADDAADAGADSGDTADGWSGCR